MTLSEVLDQLEELDQRGYEEPYAAAWVEDRRQCLQLLAKLCTGASSEDAIELPRLRELEARTTSLLQRSQAEVVRLQEELGEFDRHARHLVAFLNPSEQDRSLIDRTA